MRRLALNTYRIASSSRFLLLQMFSRFFHFQTKIQMKFKIGKRGKVFKVHQRMYGNTTHMVFIRVFIL